MNIIDHIIKQAHWIKKANHDYACLMIRTPYKLNQHILTIGNNIDKNKLNEEGLEKLTHVTVLYGLQDSDKNRIKFKGPIELENEPEISYFNNEERSVAIVKIISPYLSKIHHHLRNSIPNADERDEYISHMTIGYLKPGERLEDIKIPIVKWKVDRLLFVSRNGSEDEILLF